MPAFRLLTGCVLVMILTQSVWAEPPAFEFKPLSPNPSFASVQVTEQGDAIIFVVSDERGIGAAKIVRHADTWPAKAIVTFEGFTTLEGLSLTDGEILLQTQLGTDQQEQKHAEGHYFQRGTRKLDNQRPEFTALIDMQRRGQNIEIVLPALLLDPKKTELEIQWIDFYRN